MIKLVLANAILEYIINNSNKKELLNTQRLFFYFDYYHFIKIQSSQKRMIDMKIYFDFAARLYSRRNNLKLTQKNHV